MQGDKTMAMSLDKVPLSAVHEVRDNCLCLASQRAARRLARRFDVAFIPLGITNGQFSLMMTLNAPMRWKMGALAEFLAMDRTTLTAALKALHRRGLITVSSDPDDRRARHPALTVEGRALLAKALPLWRQEHAILERGLPAFTADILRAGLKHLG